MKMKFMALGGLEENGKNCYIVEDDTSIIVLDAGSRKFIDSNFGIDYVINDYTYLLERIDKIKGILVSHAHDDQIGGIKILLKQINKKIPVYGSNYTISFLQQEYKYSDYKIINYKEPTKIGSFVVEPFLLSHAVFGNFGFLVAQEKNAIVYATDYNFNQSLKENIRTDIAKIIKLKTNYNIVGLFTETLAIDHSGTSTGIQDFFKSFQRNLESNQGKVFITLYSTNLIGMINIIEMAQKLNKKLVIVGRDLLTYVNVSKKLGYIEHVSDMFIKIRDISRYNSNEIMVVVSGTYLEPFEQLEKLAKPGNEITTINEEDLVLVASDPFDEIEGMVQKILDKVSRTECTIKTQKVSYPSHAYAEDVKMLINLFAPKFLIPIKGEYRKFKEFEKISQSLGYDNKEINLLSNGDIVEITENEIVPTGFFKTKDQLINSSTDEFIHPLLMKDRETISQEGYVLVTFVVDKHTKKVINTPNIISGGLMAFDNNEELMKKCEEVVMKIIIANDFEINVIKVKNKIRKLLENKIGKSPLILTGRQEIKSENRK